MADKYYVSDLKSLAAEKVRHRLSTDWRLNDLIPSLKLLYENTVEADRILKDIFIQRAHENFNGYLIKPKFAELCMEIPEIGWDLLIVKMKPNPRIPRVGTGVEIACTKPDCTRLVECSECAIEYFYHIDDTEEGTQVDFVCSDITCQSKWAIGDLVFCSNHQD